MFQHDLDRRDAIFVIVHFNTISINPDIYIYIYIWFQFKESVNRSMEVSFYNQHMINAENMHH